MILLKRFVAWVKSFFPKEEIGQEETTDFNAKEFVRQWVEQNQKAVAPGHSQDEFRFLQELKMDLNSRMCSVAASANVIINYEQILEDYDRLHVVIDTVLSHYYTLSDEVPGYAPGYLNNASLTQILPSIPSEGAARFCMEELKAGRVDGIPSSVTFRRTS
jgi:hypothetical protein